MFRHIGRFVEVGLKLTSVALQKDKANHEVMLRQTLGQLKGPLVKIAQFLSTIPDAIPVSYAKELATLQSQAPSMGEEKAKRRLAAELGKDWQHHFKSFDFKPFAAASLGQVHQAELHNGQIVACKIQYPHMQTSIEADLSHLSLFFSLYKRFYGAIEPDLILKEMRERLLEEIDYHHERKMLKMFRDLNLCYVPYVIDHLSTGGLLTMEKLNGHPFLPYALAQSQEFRDELAQKLFTLWYTPFYRAGLLHADPHPGNYFVTEEGEIQWCDFGCVRQFPLSFVEGVKELYYALLHEDRDRRFHAYTLWGFTHLSQEAEEAVTLWARLLFDPVLDDRMRPIQPDFSGKQGWATAQHVHKILRQSGGVRPPQTFVFMDRVAVGLGGVLMQLKAKANWHSLYQDIAHQAFNSIL